MVCAGPEDVDADFLSAFTRMMGQLVEQLMSVSNSGMPAQWMKHMNCHENESKARKSLELVKMIWEALFELAQPKDKNAWLIANADINKTTMGNSIITGPFDVQDVLNKCGFTDFTTHIHMNATICASQDEWYHHFVGHLHCKRALMATRNHSRPLAPHPRSFAAWLMFNLGLGQSPASIRRAREVNLIMSKYVYYDD